MTVMILVVIFFIEDGKKMAFLLRFLRLAPNFVNFIKISTSHLRFLGFDLLLVHRNSLTKLLLFESSLFLLT